MKNTLSFIFTLLFLFEAHTCATATTNTARLDVYSNNKNPF
ncbi:hypothetical protein Emin_1063 [Elusimicrobium minutum Pei191]|uniref:Uncharacterized protein n=1 Tax=Elusimicrobium minutum (strain Pei191) TaxID=445932 RepID=B2KDM0_ELUMP|nr:hypothetical protein [Elusimicrobium minutum]ACC98616.1 hypothetical protein Emin_1063 [Elusimicrobium minutum Pei191]